jgi:serine/threonine-protein kinase RIO1
VLLMELVADADGEPAPRLNDVALAPDDARRFHADLIRQVVRMRGHRPGICRSTTCSWTRTAR